MRERKYVCVRAHVCAVDFVGLLAAGLLCVYVRERECVFVCLRA